MVSFVQSLYHKNMFGPQCIDFRLIVTPIDGILQNQFKVARPSIFVGTPSIFESLILKEIDLYCKSIITHVLHIDLALLRYYFLRDRNKHHVTKTSQ